MNHDTTSILWYNWITSVLNFLSLGTYTFPSLNITLFSSHHSSSLNTFTPAYLISSTTFTTSLSFTSDLLIFSIKSTLLIITSSTCITLTSIHSFFINTLSSLSLVIPTCQSGLCVINRSFHQVFYHYSFPFLYCPFYL